MKAPTKLHMARVIVKADYNMEVLPKETNVTVKELARLPEAQLEDLYDVARISLEQREVTK